MSDEEPVTLEQLLATLRADEFVDFSMNPHAPALRVIVRKGSERVYRKSQFSVSLEEIGRRSLTGGDSWHQSLLCRELERTLEKLRKASDDEAESK